MLARRAATYSALGRVQTDYRDSSSPKNSPDVNETRCRACKLGVEWRQQVKGFDLHHVDRRQCEKKVRYDFPFPNTRLRSNGVKLQKIGFLQPPDFTDFSSGRETSPRSFGRWSKRSWREPSIILGIGVRQSVRDNEVCQLLRLKPGF